MSTLYISLERDTPGVDPNAEDKVFLAKLCGDPEAMQSLARKLRIKSITDFQSYTADDLSAHLGDDEAANSGLPDDLNVEWFAPADALPSISALIKHYKKNRFMLPRGRRVVGVWQDVDRTDDLLQELRHTESVLLAAAQHKVRFRFHLGE